MKFILLCIIGALLWNSEDARYFTADVLNDAAEFIRPESNQIRINFWSKMRLILAAIVLIIGANIGINAINAVSNIQNERTSRICKQLPTGASYDEMCKDFR